MAMLGNEVSEYILYCTGNEASEYMLCNDMLVNEVS